MKKATPMTIFIIIFVIILAVCGCYLLYQSTKQNSNNTISSDVKETLPPDAPITTPVPNEGDALITKNGDKYKATIVYKKSDNAKINESLETNLNTIIETFAQSSKEQDGVSILNATCIQTHYNNQTVSYVFTTEESYIGARETLNTKKTFNYNTKTGEQLELKDILDQKGLENLSTNIIEYFKTTNEYKDATDDEQFTIGTKADYENFKNFSISDETFSVYFQKHSIMPGAYGHVEAHIDIAKIKPSIK